MNEINVKYDIDNLSIEIKTTKYKRSVKCKTLDSFIEEIRRTYLDLKDYSKSFRKKESE